MRFINPISYKMSRNDQASRILKIISLLELSSEGLRVQDIVNKLNDLGFSCTRRTVYRDLEAIQNCGFPVENSDSGTDAGIWKITKLKSLGSKVVVTYEELFALFLARESLKNYEGTVFHSSLESFFSKFESMLGENSSTLLSSFCSTVGIKVKAQWAGKVAKSVIDNIQQSCATGKKIEIEYIAASGEGAGVQVKRKLGPECVYFADSGAYLVAHDFDKHSVRVFSISRITSINVSDDNYVSKIENPEEYFSSNFGLMGSGRLSKVVISIGGKIAPYVVERKWHKSQKVEKTDSGYIVSFQVKVNSELVSWILGLGNEALVLEPEDLIKEIQLAASSILDRYTSKKAA